MSALLFYSALRLRAGLVAFVTILAILCPQTVLAQSNWQQQQMQQQRAADQARMAQESARRAEQMRRDAQQRQMELQRAQTAQQQQQRTQWGQRPQQAPANQNRAIQPWRSNQATAQRSTQGQQRPNQVTAQRQMVPQRTFTPQRTGITRANQAAAQRRDVFNAQRGVTVRLAPNRTARVLVTRTPNRTDIVQGFRGRYSGDRAVVTVRGKTFTVPRAMVNNRATSVSGRPAFARRAAAAAAGGGGGNGGPPRRWVLSGGGNGGGSGKYTNAFNSAATDSRVKNSNYAKSRQRISEQAVNHILHGDSAGRGGHLWPGQPGKSAFPQSWSANRILDEVQSIASDSGISGRRQDDGRVVKDKMVDGVNVRVVIESEQKGGGVVTAFPTNIMRNPK
jgi:hypothetical protein